MSSNQLFAHCRAEFSRLTATTGLSLEGVQHWSQGRHTYAVWAIMLDDPQVLARLIGLQLKLDDVLAAGYCRVPHITITPCGFPANSQTHGDDFVAQACLAQVELLAQQAPAAVVLEVGGANSFSCAPFLEVVDLEGSLSRLHHQLQRITPSPADYLFVPHLTAGFYKGEFAPAPLMDSLTQVDQTPLRVSAKKLALLTYDFEVIGGPLDVVCEFDLPTRRLTWNRPLWPVAHAAAESAKTLMRGSQDAAVV